MADEPGTKPPVVTEIIPSQPDQVSGIGSLGAPFIFTLEALRYMTVGGTTHRDRVVVAHLRMPIHTMMALKASIEQVELMLKPSASSEKN
jgi:hypothetical protein